jgi:hypothetical protein
VSFAEAVMAALFHILAIVECYWTHVCYSLLTRLLIETVTEDGNKTWLYKCVWWLFQEFLFHYFHFVSISFQYLLCSHTFLFSFVAIYYLSSSCFVIPG